jgi:hypothetical protein
VLRRFSGDLGFPFGVICAIGWRVISVGGRGGETTRRSSKGSVTAGAGGIIDLALPLVRLDRVALIIRHQR